MKLNNTILGAILLALLVGCSQWLEPEDDERSVMSGSSCITCHTSETVLAAFLPDTGSTEEGGGGG